MKNLYLEYFYVDYARIDDRIEQNNFAGFAGCKGDILE